MDWKTWNDGTIPKLAQVIYDGKRLDLLPILADALEEAGHPDQTLPLLFRIAPPWHRAIRAMAPLLGGEVEEAVKWMEEFIKKFEPSRAYGEEDGQENIPPDYEGVLHLADIKDGVVEYGAEEWRATFWDNQDEFWRRYEILKNEKLDPEEPEWERGFIFGCSC